MSKEKKYDNNNLKWDVDNRICLQFPKEINTDWCDFTKPVFKVNKKTGKITIEMEYKEIEKDG